jgi:anti-sigma B factor antagonist
MELFCRPVGNRTVVEVRGDLDDSSSPKLRDRLLGLVNDGTFGIVVDLDGVGSINQTGLGVLVGAQKRVLANEGSLGLVCTKESMLKIFRDTGVSKTIRIYGTVQSAVESNG